MYCRLLVAHEDMAQGGFVMQRVIERQHGPARVAEDGIDAKVKKGLYEHLCSAALRSGSRSGRVERGVRKALGEDDIHDGYAAVP